MAWYDALRSLREALLGSGVSPQQVASATGTPESMVMGTRAGESVTPTSEGVLSKLGSSLSNAYKIYEDAQLGPNAKYLNPDERSAALWRGRLAGLGEALRGGYGGGVNVLGARAAAAGNYTDATRQRGLASQAEEMFQSLLATAPDENSRRQLQAARLGLPTARPTTPKTALVGVKGQPGARQRITYGPDGEIISNLGDPILPQPRAASTAGPATPYHLRLGKDAGIRMRELTKGSYAKVIAALKNNDVEGARAAAEYEAKPLSETQKISARKAALLAKIRQGGMASLTPYEKEELSQISGGLSLEEAIAIKLMGTTGGKPLDLSLPPTK